jgi:hypothetical protein
MSSYDEQLVDILRRSNPIFVQLHKNLQLSVQQSQVKIPDTVPANLTSR